MANSSQDQKSETIRNYRDTRFLICNSCLWCLMVNWWLFYSKLPNLQKWEAGIGSNSQNGSISHK